MGKKKLQQVVNITNNGVNNGIMANNVIVPADKEIPLANNYTIRRITDTSAIALIHSSFIYEIKPRQGVWYEPFIATPKSEHLEIKGRILPRIASAYATSGTSGTLTFRLGKDTLSMTLESINKATTSKSPIFFACSKPPSILVFGDNNDPAKVYFVKFF